MTYYIREKFYMYGDDFNYYQGESDYLAFASNDRQQAIKKFEELERKAYRSGATFVTLTAFEHGEYNSEHDALEKLKEYFSETFNININLGKALDFNFPVQVPNQATDAQVDDIRKILGVTLHVIVEVPEVRSYFMIQQNSVFFNNVRPPYGNRYASQNEAESASIQKVLYFLFGPERDKAIPGFIGNLSDLSASPIILEKYLAQSEYFSFDFENCEITRAFEKVNKWEWEYQEPICLEMKGLIPLLKTIPYIIEEVKL